MSTNPTPHPQDPTPTQQAPDADYYRHVLNQVIEINLNLARALDQQTQAHITPAAPEAEPGPSLVTIAAAINDTSRTIRRCILVGLEVAKPIAAAPNPEQRRVAARKRVIREVEDKIHRHAADEVEAQTLNAELQERLDSLDFDDAVDTRPIPEIIAELCRDFGLEASPLADPWKRRTPQDIAQLQARAASPRANAKRRPWLTTAATQPPNAPRCRGAP